jgi:hypothetical protein
LNGDVFEAYIAYGSDGSIRIAVSKPDKNSIAGIYRMNAVNNNVFQHAAVNRFDGYCRSKCIEDFKVFYGYIFKPSNRRRSEFDSAGARSYGSIRNINVIIPDIGYVRFEANTIVGRIDITISNPHVFAITYINAIVIPIGIAHNRHTVDDKVFTSVVCLYPASGVFYMYSPQHHIATFDHFDILWSCAFSGSQA